MIEAENIDFMFPWLAPKFRYINQQVDDLKNCRVLRALRQTKKFILSHPLISLFLGFSITFGFLPFIVVGGSLFVTLYAALTALASVFFAAFACFLTVLFPILITAASVVLCVYVPYCLAMKILRFLKRLGNAVMPYTSTLQESFSFSDYRQGKAHEQDLTPANDEMCGQQYVHHNDEERYLNKTKNPQGAEYQHSLNGDEHLYRPYRDYLYNMSGVEYWYNHHGREDYRYNSNGSRNF